MQVSRPLVQFLHDQLQQQHEQRIRLPYLVHLLLPLLLLLQVVCDGSVFVPRGSTRWQLHRGPSQRNSDLVLLPMLLLLVSLVLLLSVLLLLLLLLPVIPPLLHRPEPGG